MLVEDRAGRQAGRNQEAGEHREGTAMKEGDGEEEAAGAPAAPRGPFASTVGIVVLLYACFALATASRPLSIPRRAVYPAGAGLSVLGGAMGATFGAAAGPLYVIYLNSRQLERDAFRVTITTILTVQGCLRIAGYARLGFYDHGTLILIAAGIPLMLVGSALGLWLAGRLHQRWFNLGIGVLLLISGTALLFK